MAQDAMRELMEKLARGKPIAAIVLRGTDAYLRDLCLKKIIEKYVPEGARDWALARIPAAGEGVTEALERAQTMPMLAPQQVIIVEDAQSIEKLGEEARARVVEALASYFESPAPFSTLIFEAAELDERQKFFKLLRDKALIVELAVNEQSARALATQMASDLGTKIQPEAAALLVEISNNEPARIRIEMEKLAAYVHGGGAIAVSDVRALVRSARRNDTWQLADMIAARDRPAAFEFLDNMLREGEEPIVIVGGLAWRYRKLIQARELPANINGYQAARSLGIGPEAAAATVRNAHQLPMKELLVGLAALAEADNDLKFSPPDRRALMEFLITGLTSQPAASPPGSRR